MRERWTGQLLEQCALVYSIEKDFRRRIDRMLKGMSDVNTVREWQGNERQQARAMIELLTTDRALTDAVEEVRTAGIRVWQLSEERGEAIQHALDSHAVALARFVAAAQSTVRTGRVI